MDVQVYHVFGGVDSLQRSYQVMIHLSSANRPNKQFSNDVYQSMYIKCTYSTTPPQNVFFSPKNYKKKKHRKTHGGMRGCDESVATWRKNVGRGFLSQIQSAFWYFPLKNLRLETSSSHPGFLNFWLSRFA